LKALQDEKGMGTTEKEEAKWHAQRLAQNMTQEITKVDLDSKTTKKHFCLQCDAVAPTTDQR